MVSNVKFCTLIIFNSNLAKTVSPEIRKRGGDGFGAGYVVQDRVTNTHFYNVAAKNPQVKKRFSFLVSITATL
jgi:hypothetical protein